MYGWLLLLHILSATVWTGGHIVLSIVILPRVLKEKSLDQLQQFESGYEKIGMPALVIQIVTGFMMAYHLLPDMSQWFNWANPIAHTIIFKIALLLLTLGLALNARFRVIPNLNNENLPLMAWHIIAVTLISILFVVVGVSFRTGWFY